MELKFYLVFNIANSGYVQEIIEVTHFGRIACRYKCISPFFFA